MLYIRKNKTSKYIKQCRDKIICTPGYSKIVLPKDTRALRDLFDLMPKSEIRKSLCEEQHGLCAYCMRRIVPEKQDSDEEEARIEHYIPLSVNKELALEYGNYLGVCYGGNKDGRDEDGKIVSCCDAYRSNRELTINPWDARQMEAIAYRRDGFLFVKKDVGLDRNLVDRMQKDIDEILHLNGELMSPGVIGRDTTSHLIANRKRIYDSVSSQIERWDKKGLLTSRYVEEKIGKLYGQLKKDGDAEPFVGVRIYFLKRKYRVLVKQGR